MRSFGWHSNSRMNGILFWSSSLLLLLPHSLSTNVCSNELYIPLPWSDQSERTFSKLEGWPRPFAPNLIYVINTAEFGLAFKKVCEKFKVKWGSDTKNGCVGGYAHAGIWQKNGMWSSFEQTFVGREWGSDTKNGCVGGCLRGRNHQNSIPFILELECHPKERIWILFRVFSFWNSAKRTHR